MTTSEVDTPSRGPVREGYLAATVGGLAGTAVAATIGIVWMNALMTPDGGLGDLVYLLIPILLAPVGTTVGTWGGLRLRGHDHALATAAVAAAILAAAAGGAVLGITFVPLTLVVLGLVPAAPVVARWIVLERTADRTPPAS